MKTPDEIHPEEDSSHFALNCCVSFGVELAQIKKKRADIKHQHLT